MVLPFVNPCDYGDPEPCGVNPSFVYTRYPCDFDDPRPTDTRGLPVTVDNRTPVRAEVVNRQRESILAVEAELGIQPSGIFTTVRARLDALEGVLCNIWENIQNKGSPVNVSFNGSTIVVGVQDINFTGTGVEVVDAGGHQANIQITGGPITQQFICNVDGYMPVHAALNVTSIGQQLFTLPNVPYKDLLLLFIGGIKQEIGDYIVSSNQLEWLGVELDTEDVVEVFFTVYGGQGDGYEPIHEALPVDVLGQTVFYLDQDPWNDLVLLFISGIKQEISNYTVNGNVITWIGTTSLVLSDVVEVLYFKRVPGENCGSGSILSIANESIIVENNVDVIDFQGSGITATGDGNGRVTVTVAGTTTIMHQEVFTSSLSQTSFNISYTPVSQQATELFIDGVSQTIGTDYIVSGTTVTYLGTPTLIGGEEVVVKYFEDLSVTTNPELSDVLLTNNLTGGFNINFGNTTTCINVLDPVSNQDVATKVYVDNTINSKNLADTLGVGNSADGYNIDLVLSSRVINVLNPVNSQDVATKNYVDTLTSTFGLSTVLAINNDSDGYDILMSGNSSIHSPDASGLTQTLTIRTGDSTTSNTGLLTLRGGNTLGNAQGGGVAIYGGNAPIGQLTSVGGAVNLTGGIGGLTGGSITLTGGGANTSTVGSNGGTITVTAGTGYNNGHLYLRTAAGTRPGNIQIEVGTANVVGGTAGTIILASGDATATSIAGGSLTLRAGDSSSGNGGSTIIRGGNSSTSGTAGDLTLQSGTGNLSNPTSVAGNVNINGSSAGLKGGDLLLTGGTANIATAGSKGGSIIMRPGNGDLSGSVTVDIDNLADGYFGVIDNVGTGLYIGTEAITTASHNYALVWDQDGYNKYVPFPTPGGYLGVDVFVNSVSDFPPPFGGYITLAPNTVYGIDRAVNIGTNIIIASNGSKIIGGGTSTTSAIISTSTFQVLSIGVNNVTIDGLMIQNLGTGPAVLIAADNYSVLNSKFVTSGNAAVVISNPGLGQINDSFIHVPQNGSGILVNQNTTSFLVKNTKFKGVGIGYGIAINIDSVVGTSTVSQVVVDGCNFEDLGTSIYQANDMIVDGNLAAIGCSGTNINTFIRTEVGSVTQAAAIVNNIIWNCSLFSVGLVPSGNHVFRGNLMHGIAQVESPII